MSRRSGFTLIELVVVIMILGILAAVAAPKFLNTSGTATDNGLKQTLSIIRDAIEMYTAKYGSIPALDASPNTVFKGKLCNFMRCSVANFPANPVGPILDNNVTGVTTTTATGTGTGWMYNTLTGEFICNSTATSPNVGGLYSSF